ncbi:glycosyltransferase family 2 protein [Thermosynechococcus sp. CL-1]|uniref:glycosyltransferase family 2 protein n=1 Tax=Thermosynechococcus sp. CL-1 TaxID=2583530 RepID=UPI00122DE907|nr:glycosyltransferase family 2 protein [Thermosynechococcus sp. CL-1]QEP99942.1 glycosyltransferase family 2 protein [Thermosynechococcus sp. CL-1]
MDYRILAYITAYNDSSALNRCIESLINQTYKIDQLLIVDNSSKPLTIQTLGNNLSIEVKHHPENIGVAGGLALGIQYAIQNKFDFIWLFDQDSTPYDNALENLINFYENYTNKSEIGILSCLVKDQETGQIDCGFIYKNYRFCRHKINSSNMVYECDAVITSGTLLNCHAAKKISLPNESLFIDAVDFDYCMKLREKNYKIFTICNGKINHRFGNSKSIQLFKKSKTIYLYSSLRYFYVHRNHTYLETRLSKNYFFFIIGTFYRVFKCLRKIFVILLFEDSEKCLKIYACLKGTVDGLLRKLGKTWT